MAQWGQGQPGGYQYPMQTGFPGQNPQGFGGLQPQPTGFPGQPQFQQPQQTGFPGPSGFQQPQPTGFQSPGLSFQRRAPPPVPPIPSQFQGQQSPIPPQNRFGGPGLAPQPTGFPGAGGGLAPQQTGFPGAGGGLAPQPTGFPGGGGFGGAARPLVPQATGYIDPRLQMMSNQFMPANPSMPYSGGLPQLQQLNGPSLQQSFQQHNQEVRGTAAPSVPWELSRAEKKKYDQVFRGWDTSQTGFLDGKTALEVFGQSGLDKNDLAKIWSLADADNRGKLNMAEFHVAMGLIYRRLNGNAIPDVLPPELVPPSHRDLDTSVNFLKDILKNDTRARSPGNIDTPVSRLKERSFNSPGAAGAGGRQDATVYKHSDSEPPGGFYQSRSRHLDRSAVRVGNESAGDDLTEMKRQLENTAKMLDRASTDNANRTREDEELDREMSDLRYRVKRVQDDLDYVSRGPRSATKDEERRRLERELMQLLHERVPEVEKRIEERDRRKEREQRDEWRQRDERNERFGRYGDRDRDEDRYRERDDERYGRDREYGRYDRDREDDRYRGNEGPDRAPSRGYSRYEEDRYDRPSYRNGGYDRPRSPVGRTPPPPPPAAEPPSSISKPPPPPPAPTASPAPNTKNMTAEERKAFIQAEAKRRMEERMRKLGVGTPAPSSSGLDTSVEDRLAQEKKEAEEKAKAAEKEAEERERIRQERLQNEKASKPPAPAAPTPPTSTPAAKPPPPPIVKRAPAPPPPRKQSAPAIRSPAVSTPPAPIPPVSAPPPPAAPEVDPEEEAFRKRQEVVKKQREEREARIRQLEQEEEDARRAEEEYQKRRQAFATRTASPAPPPALAPVSQPAPSAAAPPPPPPPPPAPPAPTMASPPPAEKSSTNPFSKLMGGPPSVNSPAATPGGTNPFYKGGAGGAASSPSTVTPQIPAPSKSPAPPPVKTSYHTAPSDTDDEWETLQEKDQDDDSSDDDLGTSRNARSNLAAQLFGSILPTRPQSAGPMSPQSATPKPATPVPAAPPPPAAPVAPPPPAAPAAPPPPPAAAIAAPAPSGDRGALLSAIQGGARLRKAQTNDRSSAGVAGKVVGDNAPPDHINAAPRVPSPTIPQPARASEFATEMPAVSESSSDNDRARNRQSVDWYAGLAADQGMAPARETMPTMAEEDEDAGTQSVPGIEVSHENGSATTDPLDDVDKSVELRVRSLYPYEGQRAEDLSFGENMMLTAHPSKSGTEWWFGTLQQSGKSGFFPQTYVQQVQTVQAKALYSYTGGNPDELPFVEGDTLTIVDRGDADWWKADQGGMVFIVPAAYLELEG